MGYGLKVQDVSGNTCVLTPDIKNIISSGTVLAPLVLWSDGTYGINIELPGTTAYALADIGVLVTVRKYTPSAYQTAWVDWGLSPKQWSLPRWLYDGGVFFTRNDSTGVMTAFTEQAWKDTFYNFHPIAFWDKMGATTFNRVRLFAGIVYYVYDASASSYIKVYNLGLITYIDYVVYLKNM